MANHIVQTESWLVPTDHDEVVLPHFHDCPAKRPSMCSPSSVLLYLFRESAFSVNGTFVPVATVNQDKDPVLQ